MSITQQNNRFQGIQWDKLIPDVLGLLFYYFFFDTLLDWQLRHQSLSCSCLMMLNIIAVGFAGYHFFSGYRDEAMLKKWAASLTKAEGYALGLSAFISCFAFCWWLTPFTAVKEMGVKETGFFFGAVSYFLVYVSVVAVGVNPAKNPGLPAARLLKIVAPVITSFFFFFSYVFLIMTLQHWQPSFMGAKALGILCLVIFYLPLRFFILLKPPTARIEYLSFLFSFCFMLYKLFGKI